MVDADTESTVALEADPLLYRLVSRWRSGAARDCLAGRPQARPVSQRLRSALESLLRCVEAGPEGICLVVLGPQETPNRNRSRLSVAGSPRPNDPQAAIAAASMAERCAGGSMLCVLGGLIPYRPKDASKPEPVFEVLTELTSAGTGAHIQDSRGQRRIIAALFQ